MSESPETTLLGREAPGRVHRWTLAAYAVSVVLCFPHALPAGGAIDLGLVVSWLLPGLLVLGIRDLAPRRAAAVAFAASMAGHVVLFHWFMVVTVTYGGMPYLLGLLSPLVPALYVSIFTALFALLWSGLRRAGAASVVVGAAAWVAVDWARAHFLGGFPWATLGYGLHQDLPLLGLTRLGGVYALSFAAAGVGLAGAAAYEKRDRASGRVVGVTLLVVLVAHGLGAALQRAEPGETRTIRMAAIQGNIDQGHKWDAERRSRILETYLDLSEQAAEQGAEWIVWPETAVPGLIEGDRALAARLALLAQRNDATLVVGGMGITPDATGQRIGAFHDSAFSFDSRGEVIDRYDKTHLVPFGEFVPLRAFLGRFFESLATGLSTTDVTAGARPRLLRVEGADAGDAPTPVGVPICYELLFPHLVREFGAEGAGVLLAITNDAWYGRTGAPHQFLAMTAMRAAENGRWVVRAANTGVSAIIDDRGGVLERSALFEEAVLVGDVPVVLSGERTFYARFGDVFAWTCVLGVGGVWVRNRRIEKRRFASTEAAAAADEDREG